MPKLPSVTGFYVNDELKTKLNERISQISKIRAVFFSLMTVGIVGGTISFLVPLKKFTDNLTFDLRDAGFKICGYSILAIASFFILRDLDYDETVLRSILDEVLKGNDPNFKSDELLDEFIDNKKELYKIENRISPLTKVAAVLNRTRFR